MSSSVFKWPNRREVNDALHSWAEEAAKRHPEAMRIGFFGSYARGDWGVGSDLDLVVIVEHSGTPFERRSLEWNVHELPVPVQHIVYTAEEWKLLRKEGGRFARTLEKETVWVYGT
ncbi:MAG: nucleotidyltransferase domain-containing protein [Desulfomonilaceae bacterium]|nr:nucleotidyltransferase domain-containing protein [Desulfomonilaceae bacterium]